MLVIPPGFRGVAGKWRDIFEGNAIVVRRYLMIRTSTGDDMARKRDRYPRPLVLLAKSPRDLPGAGQALPSDRNPSLA